MGKKQKNWDPLNPADDHKGDWWDHVAFDPEHKLVPAVVPGARVTESVEEVVAEVKDRLGDQPPALMTSDEYAAYETVIATTFSEVVPPAPAGPGRRPLLPERRPDPDLTYATVHKEREKDRVVAVHRKVVLGSQQAVDRALQASVCSRTIHTSFVERQHATDRGRNARKTRKTYKFSKDWRVHEAMTYFTLSQLQLLLGGADVAHASGERELAASNPRDGGRSCPARLVTQGVADLPCRSVILRHDPKSFGND